MRLHISLDDDLVRDLDLRVGRRRRSAFIASAVRRALDDERRWNDIERAIGRVAEAEHDWDADPGSWVREQRAVDSSRVG
jgi:metal-responsive CopG/Arc/MetJ family transcriptional regulator